MKESRESGLQYHLAEVIYSVIVLLWYILPLLIPRPGWFDPLTLASTLYGSPPTAPGSWVLVSVLAWAVPVICIWKIASFFLHRTVPVLADPAQFLPILLNLVASGIVVALVVLHMLNQAHNARYFSSLPGLTYVVAAVSLVWNGVFIVRLIALDSSRDQAYREYLEFRRSSNGKERRVLSVVLQRQGIQRKQVLTFVPMILVIIAVMAFFLLRDFSGTIRAAVDANGAGLADRTASVVKANPGDQIALDDYFGAEAKKNQASAGQASAFRYNTLSFYLLQKTGGFDIKASTDPQLAGTHVARELTLDKPISQYNAQTQSYEFLTPVTLGKEARFIGYVMVDYARDVIFEPYFRTQIKVFTIAGIFMYASIFLIYLFGRAIVFPILFLRMSVNSIANVLTNMIKGKVRPVAGLLEYKDRITTHDEIKDLSGEVNHMTAVIRGVIPYISGSTLQAASKDKPTSERRNLTLLFTDIRGFTTISESLPPEKVVEMLNHYLDLQATIVHDNNGEVDKFVGDEMMATFKGPKRDLDACKAAVEIRKAMAKEKELARAQGRESVTIGIGINSGPVIFGSMGAKERMDFTSIGDTVNLAARLEGTNKEYGTKTLVTESVYEKVKDAFLCREIDLVTVKGKSQPARIFEVLQETKGSADKLHRMKKVFEESLDLFRKRKWDAADKGFRSLVDDLNDDASVVFLDRIREFRENPPPKNWDGVYHRTSK
ncbi:MAG TPA: adenylate/guanylate cyclase domain-containing protein [Spirochaetia bacterium]|nr:adenylate/guanylate cyclase domain-containing protein [Spirochaetia bacterium]